MLRPSLKYLGTGRVSDFVQRSGDANSSSRIDKAMYGQLRRVALS